MFFYIILGTNVVAYGVVLYVYARQVSKQLREKFGPVELECNVSVVGSMMLSTFLLMLGCPLMLIFYDHLGVITLAGANLFCSAILFLILRKQAFILFNKEGMSVADFFNPAVTGTIPFSSIRELIVVTGMRGGPQHVINCHFGGLDRSYNIGGNSLEAFTIDTDRLVSMFKSHGIACYRKVFYERASYPYDEKEF